MAELKIPKKMIDDALDNILNKVMEQVRSDTGMSFNECCEKQIPKKARLWDEIESYYLCPTCDTPICNKRISGYVYCPYCGQKLDWGEEDG